MCWYILRRNRKIPIQDATSWSFLLEGLPFLAIGLLIISVLPAIKQVGVQDVTVVGPETLTEMRCTPEPGRVRS